MNDMLNDSTFDYFVLMFSGGTLSNSLYKIVVTYPSPPRPPPSPYPPNSISAPVVYVGCYQDNNGDPCEFVVMRRDSR